jgi:predicted unusual protein kinase regulating ubiquinone biosynthesis (AarF/ABC1/UbiB family)
MPVRLHSTICINTRFMHCDIHYGNFIIDSNDKACIIDFGYSEVFEDEELFEKKRDDTY